MEGLSDVIGRHGLHLEITEIVGLSRFNSADLRHHSFHFLRLLQHSLRDHQDRGGLRHQLNIRRREMIIMIMSDQNIICIIPLPVELKRIDIDPQIPLCDPDAAVCEYFNVLRHHATPPVFPN